MSLGRITLRMPLASGGSAGAGAMATTANGSSSNSRISMDRSSANGRPSSAPTTSLDLQVDDDTVDDSALRGASGQGYLWEEAYKRSWDVLKEDDDGTLTSVIAALNAQKRRRVATRDTRPLHRGIIRYLYLVLDLSRSIGDNSTVDHLKGTKLDSMIATAERFIQEFFDANPLGSLGIVVTKGGGAEKITELIGNASEHLEALKRRDIRDFNGDASLQNALEICRRSLKHVPGHAARDILVLYGALNTCDPRDIFETAESLKSDKVRVSIVGLSAEVHVCRKICQITGGTYAVVMNDQHMKEIMAGHVIPPAIPANSTKAVVQPQTQSGTMIKMGFPKQVPLGFSTLCAAHKGRALTGAAFVCPTCGAAVCGLPCECPWCGLMLVSGMLLARSYHHLFPMANFTDVSTPNTNSSGSTSSSMDIDSGSKPQTCFGCKKPLLGPSQRSGSRSATTPVTPANTASSSGVVQLPTGRFECENCRQHFCLECDLFLHEVLHNCPGCDSIAR